MGVRNTVPLGVQVLDLFHIQVVFYTLTLHSRMDWSPLPVLKRKNLAVSVFWDQSVSRQRVIVPNLLVFIYD